MDQESFEQYNMTADAVGQDARFLQDGMVCNLLYWNDQVIGMTPPAQVVLRITYTEPAVKGNTSSNITKAATLETGAEVFVPAFIEMNELIKIDTASGSYLERVRE